MFRRTVAWPWVIRVKRLTGILALGCVLSCCSCGDTRTMSPSATPSPIVTSTAPAEAPTVTATRPTRTPHSTESMWLDFVSPITGALVTAPIRFQGRTNEVPSDPGVTVRLYDQNWRLLTETTVTLQGEPGKSGTFSGEITVSDYAGQAILTADSHGGGASISARITIKNP